ncbi:hypothetical protein J5J86_07110 [Aquabacter sp. L1I39]|uniref:hypothetical protein n=1 Tax=Aquabacter sp. L1I39 TaxID=2820278 RepID=UPI001AD98CEC|nr:hypothetical protein [Aquabacter sp. L1I39]QTL05066.1 hypothetical protein J5J86_07110 [Aquabacter sp. L1I39]
MPTEVEEPLQLNDEDIFLECLRDLGGDVNSRKLREKIGWDKEKFLKIRNQLLANGQILKAHGGPGGKTIIPPAVILDTRDSVVSRESQDDTQSVGLDGTPCVAPDVAAAAGPESALYKPMLDQIDKNWSRSEGYYSCITRNTANGGRKTTGGKWTRPDISMIAMQKFKFLKNTIIDIISFEIKPRQKIGVEGVFEALSHRQYVNRSYLIFNCTNDEFNRSIESARIIDLADHYGIGVILSETPDDYETWDERVYGRRWDPDPSDLNEFLQNVFSANDHDEIIRFIK